MKTNYSHIEIATLIKNHYPDANNIQAILGGMVSQTFLFWSDNRKRVFQIGGKRKDYEKQLYISERYKDILSVKIIDKVHENTDAHAYIFSDYIEKCRVADLNAQEFIDIIPSILDTIDKLSEIEAPANSGFGKFDANGIASFSNWRDYIEAIYNDEVYDWLKFRRFDYTIINKAIAILQENINCIKIDQQPYLIFGDMGENNLLADGKQITGMIDWDYAMYGDPLYEIATVLFWYDNEDSKKYAPLVSALKDKYLSSEINKMKIYCYIIRMSLEEIYNTVVLDAIGYDISWVINRLNDIVSANSYAAV